MTPPLTAATSSGAEIPLPDRRIAVDVELLQPLQVVALLVQAQDDDLEGGEGGKSDAD